MFRLASLLVLALCCSAPVLAQPVALSLDEVAGFAANQSRQLAAYRAQALAARERAVAAAQRPDPVLRLGINNLPIDGADRFSVARDFMTMRSVGVMQELTRADKLLARSERARLDADVAEVASQQALATLQRDAAMAWFDRSFQESMRALLVEQQAQARLQADAAETLYRGNRGSQADVLLARAQIGQLDERIAAAEQQIAAATTRLTRWIGLAASRPLQPRPALVLPAWTGEDLERHLPRHPQIAALAQQEAVAAAEVRMAAADRQPDWSVELMFNQRGSAYSNMVSLNFSLPLQWDRKSRQDRELAARQALADKALAEREDMQRAHVAEVRAMLQEWQGAQRRLAHYGNGLIPLAQQRSAASLVAYRSGSGMLPAVLEARRAEIDTRIEALRIEMELARLWSELTYLLPHGDDAAEAITSRTTP
ncbi:TolC family protein [Piscinibacter sp. XHJ-5]|uniref:TolC family protein n=1 Tax=Piscinibacter sp. XHJ-5 TaxID=3037797 RepID=UPI002452D3A0|nr:TolC family protein [Piscinibacter sp. XHJ-5]